MYAYLKASSLSIRLIQIAVAKAIVSSDETVLNLCCFDQNMLFYQIYNNIYSFHKLYHVS